jgi:hypothetical protein
MASPRNRRHILVPNSPSIEAYRSYRPKIKIKEIPLPWSRFQHGSDLKRSLEQAYVQAKEHRRDAGVQVQGAVPGLYIQFESQPDIAMKLEGLEARASGIELLAVTYQQTDEPEPKTIERATVFVPDGKLKHFFSRFEKYMVKTPRKRGERRYEDLLDRIGKLRLATLRALWTDTAEAYPDEGKPIWWEVWLRRHDGRELQRLTEFAGLLNLALSERRLEFDDRIVTLLYASPLQLATSIDVLNDLAEVRKAKETADFFASLPPEEEMEWAKDLRARTTGPDHIAPAVCILDTGVNRGHLLLENALAPEDCHAIDPDWGTNDHDGHGTEMAGLALFGDLVSLLDSDDPHFLKHRLESVKILPRDGANPPDLYGAITAEATGRVEIQAPDRRRFFSMAITATDKRDRGQPTSWSAAVDALSVGRTFDSSSQGLVYLDDESDSPRRLFIVSTGNVEALEVAYLDRSDTEPVHDPAQAWNALTVGAFTQKAHIQDPSWEDWKPIARAGDLSPWSTTSVSFRRLWPIKPDVVFEGGNAVFDSKGEVDYPVPDLSLLSTYYKPNKRPFVLTWATSAASAQVARMAAIISSEYPVWPETVRALIVHSAQWTREMKRQLRGAGGKRRREMLVRRYGFGVPDLTRALRSANDALTLMIQGRIRPFGGGKMRDMHLHQLPWPRDELEGLGDAPAQLRVTLSYFIEPNPGRRGWKRRYRYASHGLRFSVIKPTETVDEFRKRINQFALEEDEEKPNTGGDSSDWYLGEQSRNHGSLHSDIWVGTAADLAERGVIGVYPVSGWWKDDPRRDRSDRGVPYSLVVSIGTQATDVDIWTPVASQVGVPIEVEGIKV